MTVVNPEIEADIADVLASATAGEAARYFAASVAALAMDSALLWLAARELEIAPWLAGAASYTAGLILIYTLSTSWVFAERVEDDRFREFLLFAALGVVGLALNSITLFTATGFGMALLPAKALSAGIGFTVNFASRKMFLFSKSRPAKRA